MLKLKVVVVGPPEAGKSYFSNILGDVQYFEGYPDDRTNATYIKTQTVRIVDCFRRLPSINADVPIELWDIGGDIDSALHSAVMTGAHGAVFLYNPDVPSHKDALDRWYHVVCNDYQIPQEDCLIIGYGRELDTGRALYKPAKLAEVGGGESRLNAYNKESLPSVSSVFDNYAGALYQKVDAERKEKNKGGDDDDFDS